MSLTSRDDCTTVQNFCSPSIGAETVGLMMEKDNSFEKQIDIFPIINKYELIKSDLYNKIKEILNNINEFGNEPTSLDSRNPLPKDINNITDETAQAIIFYDNYNKILKILNKNDLLSEKGTTLITKEIIEKLKDYIKEYHFNQDRCNFCNITSDCQQSCHNSGGGGCDDSTTVDSGCDCSDGGGCGGCETGECGLSESGCGQCQDGM